MVKSRRRADDTIRAGALIVDHEWITMVELATELQKVAGSRALIDNAVLESCLLHVRNVVNFCCGNYNGNWRSGDIKPSDFFDRPWQLADDELDETLRGRLPFINTELAHLSWKRLEDTALIVSVVLLAARASHAMDLFTRDLLKAGGRAADMFEAAQKKVATVSLNWHGKAETRAPHAPARARPTT